MMIRMLLCLCVIASGSVMAQSRAGRSGVLLLAHGGSPEWNERVASVAATVDPHHPVEVAMGMASRGTIEAAVHRLAARGVTDIVAVPLFVSSWSSVIRSTEYLLGLRPDAPADLALFAKMHHGAHGEHGAGGHCAPPCDPTSPVPMPLPVRMTPALNRHPLVGGILADRAREISTAPEQEAVVLVAHGPVPDDDNSRWLADMAELAGHVRRAAPFAAVHALTVRDDADAALKQQATEQLRAVVTAESSRGRRVLIVPHLLSFGGIERGIRERLAGLPYVMAGRALAPDPRLAQWVIERASTATLDPGR